MEGTRRREMRKERDEEEKGGEGSNQLKKGLGLRRRDEKARYKARTGLVFRAKPMPAFPDPQKRKRSLIKHNFCPPLLHTEQRAHKRAQRAHVLRSESQLPSSKTNNLIVSRPDLNAKLKEFREKVQLQSSKEESELLKLNE